MRYAILLLILASATPVAAQTRAQQIAAEFTKLKNQTKTKYGVSSKKYREVRSKPWRVDNVRSYAGRYVSLGDPMMVEVRVSARGAITAHGRDEQSFEIRNAKIDEAILSGTKVYRDGRSEPFEAAFLERSYRSTPDEPFTVNLGIGVLAEMPGNTGITGTAHVFLRKE